MPDIMTNILQIPHHAEAIFKCRPNRYLGIVDIISPVFQRDVQVHIHDPGRLKELLYPENRVLLRFVSSSHRKTKWDVLAAQYKTQWVFIHSAYHRQIAEQILTNPKFSPFSGIKQIEAEIQSGPSRIDFKLDLQNGKQAWVEVKGCTLAQNHLALFPDAPTKRGAKHLKQLIEIRTAGSDAAILILIFRTDANCFAPNFETDPDFSTLFYQALEKGVNAHPFIFTYSDDIIFYLKKIAICPI